MNTESIIPQSNKQERLVAGKTNFAQDAFWQSVLGKEVDMVIQDLGRDYYTIHQVDQFTVIAETEEGQFLLISKSAIIAVYSDDTSIPELLTNMVEGVKRIQYKASEKRTEQSKQRNARPFKPRFESSNTSPEPRPVPSTIVQYKPRKTYERA